MIPLRDDVPTRSPPVFTIGFIVASSLVFLWQISLGERGFETIVYSLGMVPAALLQHETLPAD